MQCGKDSGNCNFGENENIATCYDKCLTYSWCKKFRIDEQSKCYLESSCQDNQDTCETWDTYLLTSNNILLVNSIKNIYADIL